MGETILVVDDSRSIRSIIVDTLREKGYDCREAADAAGALALLAAGEFSLVLSDIVMPGQSGEELLQEIHTWYSDTFVIMLTSVADTETAMRCIHLGAVDYLIKPFTIERLCVTVRNVLEQRRLFLEQRSHEVELERKVREQTEQIRQAIIEMALVTKEMEIARAIQSALIPQYFPYTDHLTFATLYRPAGHLGGDYYDIFSRGDGILDVVIADVAGHNVGSALIVAEIRGALQGQHATTSHGCSEMLAMLNEALYDDLTRAELFVSMFYLRFDERTGNICYASAGHNPQLLIRCDGTLEELDTEGMIIGVLPEVAFEEKSLAFATGDSLLFFTDGLVEAENVAGEQFGTERLAGALATAPWGNPGTTLRHLLGAMDEFLSGVPFKDDLSIVVATAR